MSLAMPSQPAMERVAPFSFVMRTHENKPFLLEPHIDMRRLCNQVPFGRGKMQTRHMISRENQQELQMSSRSRILSIDVNLSSASSRPILPKCKIASRRPIEMYSSVSN